MFKIFKKTFGIKSKSVELESKQINSEVKKSIGIQYDAQLIYELKLEHTRLVELYGRILSDGFAVKDYHQTKKMLIEFKNNFQAHLLKENLKFYVYLQQSLSDDKHNLEIVKDFRFDMNRIARVAVNFCKKYQSVFSESMVASFMNDYQEVGKVLTHRIGLEEETLYELYKES